jgi:hypothetical protein
MPAPAAELVVYVYDESEEAKVADEVVCRSGFRSSEVDGAVVHTDEYTAYHYEPFEAREENIQLLDECVETLKQRFSGMEVWLKNRPNKDYGNPVSEDYFLYIAPSRGVVESRNQTRSDIPSASDTASDVEESDVDDENQLGRTQSEKINWRAENEES